MPVRGDLRGKKFERLYVMEVSDSVRGVTKWKCVCECGSIVVVATDSLKRGGTKSCGCLKIDRARERMKATMTTHGATGTRIYRIWSTMWQRCTNPKHEKYQLYGGRGIRVCKEWEEFSAFENDMGPRPSQAHTLDRIDSNGNYEPGNVRWATQKEQQNNRRNTRKFTINSEVLTLTEIASRFHIRPALIRQRVDRDGMSIEQALAKVVRNGKSGFEIYDVVV